MPSLPSNRIGKSDKTADITEDFTWFEPDTDPMLEVPDAILTIKLYHHRLPLATKYPTPILGFQLHWKMDRVSKMKIISKSECILARKLFVAN